MFIENQYNNSEYNNKLLLWQRIKKRKKRLKLMMVTT